MLLGVSLIIVGSGVLFFAVTGDSPIDLLQGKKEEPGIGPFDLGRIVGAVFRGAPIGSPEFRPTPNRPRSTNAPTVRIRAIVTAARVIPGWSQGRICGSDTLAGDPVSEHFYCNAADLDVPGDDTTGSRAGKVIGDALAGFLVNAGRTGVLPIHCVIWWGSHWSRENRFRRAVYTGSNKHKGHVHVSAWPSVGGSC